MPTKKNNARALQPSGAYGANIQAYDDVSADRKDAFLRDAAAYLRAVGKALVLDGRFDQFDIRTNRAGIAVSGEVSADFYQPPAADGAMRPWLSVTIQQSVIHSASDRPDHIIILARIHTPRRDPKPVKRGGKTTPCTSYEMGQNCYLPVVDSQALVPHLCGMLWPTLSSRTTERLEVRLPLPLPPVRTRLIRPGQRSTAPHKTA